MIRVHYQLHDNEADYLKFLQIGWTFLDHNPNKICDLTISAFDFANYLKTKIGRFIIPIIIFIIKFCFFIGIDSFTLRQKSHICYFFQLFHKKMMKVICAMLAIVIKDLKLRINNLNLLLGKSVIRFDSSVQMRETSKQIAHRLYYKY